MRDPLRKSGRHEDASRRPRSQSSTLVLHGLLAMSFVTLAGCGDTEATGVGGEPTPAHVRVAQPVVEIESLGEEFSLGVRVESESGVEMSGVQLEWAGDLEGIAEHVGGDVFRSVGNGTADIQVTLAEGQDLTLAGDPPAVRLTVAQEPRALTLEMGSSAPGAPAGEHRVLRLWSLGQAADLSVWTVDANGYPVQEVRSGVAFASDSEGIGAVGAQGRLTAMSDGSTWIRAESGAFSGAVELVVDARLELSVCASFDVGASDSGAAGDCGTGGMQFTEH